MQRRRKILRVDLDSFIELFRRPNGLYSFSGLPVDARFHGAAIDPQKPMEVQIIIESGSFLPVPTGKIIPEIQVNIHREAPVLEETVAAEKS